MIIGIIIAVLFFIIVAVLLKIYFEYKNDYIEITCTDKILVENPVARLKENFPNILSIKQEAILKKQSEKSNSEKNVLLNQKENMDSKKILHPDFETNSDDTDPIDSNHDNNDNNEKNILPLEKKLDRFNGEHITLYQQYYKKIIGSNNCYLLQNQRDKITEIAEELGENFEPSLKVVLSRLKTMNWENIGVKPTGSWLLKDDNYIKVYEGMYSGNSNGSSPYTYVR